MVDFTKYNSLTNAYQLPARIIHSKPVPVVAMEKVDGSNLSIWITAEGVQFGRRTGWIQNDPDLFGWKTMLESKGYMTNIKALQLAGIEVVLYGEYYGEKVRTSYGSTGDLVVFDAYTLTGERYTFEELLDICDGLFPVPAYRHYPNLFEALKALPTAYNEVVSSDYTGDILARDENEFEGWVIRQTGEEGYSFGGVKHKMAAFSERDPKKVKEKTFTTTRDVSPLAEYLTENRVWNVRSHGGYTTPLELAKAVIQDAITDSGMEVEHPERLLSIAMPLVKKMNLF